MNLLAVIQDRINAELPTAGGFADYATGRESGMLGQESRLQAMTMVWEKVFDRIASIWPQGFVSTQEIRAAEIEIERVQTLVLSGDATLDDFRGASLSWEQIVNKEINMASCEKRKPYKLAI